MDQTDLRAILAFLKETEKLKNTLRSGYSSTGRQESVPEHTWRLCLMAMLFHRQYPDLNFEKLIKICIIHDLGEAINGDIPATQQNGKDKSQQERLDLLTILATLPENLREEIITLWDEYEAASTLEAQVAKALDKMETIIQHNQGQNPADFDYGFNLDYGRQYAEFDPLMKTFREIVDEETKRNMN